MASQPRPRRDVSRPPDTVTVGPVVYEVVGGDLAAKALATFDAGGGSSASTVDAGVTRGLTDPGSARIYYDETQPPTAAAVTIAHEWVHAALDHVPHGLSDDHEEAVAMALGPALVMLVRDNPELIAYWSTAGR